MAEREKRLDALRAKLTSKHAELKHRVENITDDLRQKKPKSENWEERAQESENDEVLEHLDDLGREEIQKIEISVERMEQGDYGECVACGSEIDIKRLEAVPWTGHCIECARERERARR